MRRMYISVVSIGIVASGLLLATSAFFSDKETSSENALEAGKIDLKLAYQSLVWVVDHWEPNFNGWSINDLTYQAFFNGNDVKPGDLSEGTISIQVDDNPSWLCADLVLTGLPENGVIEPEITDGDADDNSNWNGELQDELQFVMWADDGDQTFEQTEEVLFLGDLNFLPTGDGNTGLTIPLIDSQKNYWGSVGTPLNPGESNRAHLGVAWCMGELTLTPQPEANGVPQQRPPGFTCDGSLVSNISQTDKIIGDISFSAIQTRNNSDYVCNSNEVIAFTDDFNDGDTEGWWLGYSQHRPWIQGNWRVENGQLLQDQPGDGFLALYLGLQYDSQIVETKLLAFSPAGYGGITLWYQDTSNSINVRIYPAATEVWVEEKFAGIVTLHKYPYAYGENVWLKLKVVADADSGNLDIFVDDTFLFTHTASTMIRNGKTGVSNGNNGGYFDDFYLIEN